MATLLGKGKQNLDINDDDADLSKRSKLLYLLELERECETEVKVISQTAMQITDMGGVKLQEFTEYVQDKIFIIDQGLVAKKNKTDKIPVDKIIMVV